MFRRLPEPLRPPVPASVNSGPKGTAAGGHPHFAPSPPAAIPAPTPAAGGRVHFHVAGHAVRAQAPAACRYPPCTADARPDGWCSDSCRELAADIADSWRESEERDR